MKRKNNTKNKDNTFTTVKTSYARAALALLALNFCLTAYVIVNLNEATQDAIERNSGSTAPQQLAVTD
jgi:hypothetical protein